MNESQAIEKLLANVENFQTKTALTVPDEELDLYLNSLKTNALVAKKVNLTNKFSVSFGNSTQNLFEMCWKQYECKLGQKMEQLLATWNTQWIDNSVLPSSSNLQLPTRTVELNPDLTNNSGVLELIKKGLSSVIAPIFGVSMFLMVISGSSGIMLLKVFFESHEIYKTIFLLLTIFFVVKNFYGALIPQKAPVALLDTVLSTLKIELKKSVLDAKQQKVDIFLSAVKKQLTDRRDQAIN